MTETKTKQSIKSAVQEHYASFELSDDQLAQMEALQAAHASPHDKLQAMKQQLANRAVGATPSDKILSLQEGMDPDQMPSISASFQYPKPGMAQRSKRTSLLILVGVLVCLGLGWGAWKMNQNSKTTPLAASFQPLLDLVVGYGKKHPKPSETSTSLGLLQAKWKTLPFRMVESTHLPTGRWSLQGGTQTALYKQSIAVLYYKHRTSKKQATLFQMAPWAGQGTGQHAWSGTLHGVSVKLWHERGLLHILLSTP